MEIGRRKGVSVELIFASILLLIGITSFSQGNLTVEFQLNKKIVVPTVGFNENDILEIRIIDKMENKTIVITELKFTCYFSRTPLFIGAGSQWNRRWKKTNPVILPLTFDSNETCIVEIWDLYSNLGASSRSLLRKVSLKITKAHFVNEGGVKMPLSQNQFKFNKIYKFIRK